MADDNKHVLSHIDFNGDSIDIQDAVARQAVSKVSKEIAELTKNAVTNVTQGISDYTVRVTKDGLAIDVPITGLSSKLDELQGRLTNFLDSEDPQLDSLSEIIAYIQSNRSSIQDLVTDKVDVDSIVDNLDSTDASKVLSAKQGNSLKALIDAISTSISNVDNTSDSSKPVSTAQQDAINAAYANATKYADTKIADLIDGAPETMDTLKEVAEAIQVNKDVATALNEAIGKKANQVELDTHVNNTTIHTTASERANYQTAYEHSQAKHARADATKVEKSTTNGNILIDGVESNVYSHPGTGTNPHGTTKSDVGLENVGNFKAVSTVASQGLTDTEKSNARANIGAQVAGSYASSTHNHDDKYQAKGNYASVSHTHNLSTMINGLSIGTATPSDADYYVSQYAGGGDTTTTYHRRPVSALWSYIKGKADKVYAAINHTHTKSHITDFPTSMPASDVYSWAKASSKPSYTASEVGAAAASHTHAKSEVGLGNVDNTTDSAKSVKYATSAGSASSASKATGVVDYGSTAKTIQIGYGGDGISGDAIKFIAGYTTGNGSDVNAKIKDVSKDALKSWLGLGSLAYSSATIPTIPSSLPANGGNSTTVNGYTVNSNVPANAKFTDTVLTKVSELQNDSKYQTDTDVTNALIPYATIKNLKGSGTIEINGANITKNSIDADKLNIANWGAFGVASGRFIITKDDITTSGKTLCTALSSKPLTNNTSHGALVSYQKLSSAGTYYGSYTEITRGILQAGTISGKTSVYAPSFIVDGDSVTFGDIASLEIKGHELIGIFDGTTPTIVTRTLTLNAMSLAANYDGETTGRINSVSGYAVLAVIPRTSGASDVCWIHCYRDSSNVVHARLKNTVSIAKNSFKPTVEVLYRLI